MAFFLGIIIGLLVSLIIICIMIYFRRIIEQKTVVIEKVIENAGPRPKGYIIEPQSDSDEAREEIIARNRVEGRDTPISELQ